MTSHYVKANQILPSMPGTAVAELMAAVLDKDMPFRFCAPGFSMTPFIRDGDMITIASRRLRCGDVVAFVNSNCGKLIVHRIVHISRERYLIKGDNAREPDGCVSRSSILGRVIRVEHRGRQVWLGTGIERVVIAFLSLHGWLMPVVWTVWGIVKPFAGRWTRRWIE
ncbi:MAG: S24/S26 family peptidase [Deltaproteobacteria bacterium]|nr:S24/S26 family peptidase [Deltaproteobacteria bacterium]